MRKRFNLGQIDNFIAKGLSFIAYWAILFHQALDSSQDYFLNSGDFPLFF